MRITQLKLVNFRRFDDVTIPFVTEESPLNNTVVFIGDNGSGKTAILHALTMSLSWLIARINREKGNGSSITDMDILNGANASAIELQLENNQSPYRWTLAKSRKGRIMPKTLSSDISGATHLAAIFREQLTANENVSLPLIAYYPCERVVLDIPLKIKTRHSFGQLDGYDNALQQGVDFRRFFEWFRDREDAENEIFSKKTEQQLKLRKEIEKIDIDTLTSKTLIHKEELQKITKTTIEEAAKTQESRQKLNDDVQKLQEKVEEIAEKLSSSLQIYDHLKKLPSKDLQLTSVRDAIKSFMSDFDNLRMQRKPRLQMLVDKNGETLDIAQLSQGEKSLMALVGDIARRLAIMNPALENPLEGEGIVLIDEVDMHLHPNWQRSIIGRLNKTFPNCQFILTTHSPIVISEIPNLLCYSLNNGKLEKLENLYGMDVNQVLLRDMDADIRNVEIQQAFDDLLNTLQDGNLENAKALLAELEQKVAVNHIELSRARLLMRRLEIQREKNH